MIASERYRAMMDADLRTAHDVLKCLRDRTTEACPIGQDHCACARITDGLSVSIDRARRHGAQVLRNDSPPTEQEGPMGRDDVVTVTQGELDALWKAVAERDEARRERFAAERERDWLKKEIEPLRLLRDDLESKVRSHGMLKGDRESFGDETILSDLLVVLDRYNLLPEAHEYE